MCRTIYKALKNLKVHHYLSESKVEALVFDSSKLTACKAIMIVRVDLTHLCISIAYIHKLYTCLHVSEQKLKQLWSLKKMCFKKVQKLKKSFGLILNPLLRWLTTVCLHGFDRNVQRLFTIFSLHQRLQRAVMNEPKQLLISNQHIRVPRWHAFNFAQVLFRCVLGMPSNILRKCYKLASLLFQI